MTPAGLKHVAEYTKQVHTKIYFISLLCWVLNPL